MVISSGSSKGEVPQGTASLSEESPIGLRVQPADPRIHLYASFLGWVARAPGFFSGPPVKCSRICLCCRARELSSILVAFSLAMLQRCSAAANSFLHKASMAACTQEAMSGPYAAREVWFWTKLQALRRCRWTRSVPPGLPPAMMPQHSLILMANILQPADTQVDPTWATASGPGAGSHLNLGEWCSDLSPVREQNSCLAALSQSETASSMSVRLRSMVVAGDGSGPAGKTPGIFFGRTSCLVMYLLPSPLRRSRAGKCGSYPESSMRLAPTTAGVRPLLTTKKSYVAPLHVGESGATMTPCTSSSQSEESSTCGVRFQSPPSTHGPRRQLMAMAASSRMRRFASESPSQSLSHIEPRWSPPFIAMEAWPKCNLCWKESSTKPSCETAATPFLLRIAQPPLPLFAAVL